MSNVPMTRPEEALAIHETKYFHSSTFTELDDGRVLHAANTTFTTSDDGGITWSDEFKRTDVNGDPVGGGGTSLVRLSGKGIGLAAMSKTGDGRTGTGVVFWRSEDGGETWEAPVQVSTRSVATHLYQDAITRTSSGRIVIPVYISMGQGTGPNDQKPPASGKLANGQWVSTAGHFFDPHFSSVYVAYSDDDGRTWKRKQRRRADDIARLERDLQLRQRADGDRGVARTAVDDDAHGRGQDLPGLVLRQRRHVDATSADLSCVEHGARPKSERCRTATSLSSGTRRARRR